MEYKALDLFDAYNGNKLPSEGGLIISSFFDKTSTYSRYEVISYNGVKSIYLTEDGLTFQSDGQKLHILVEPPSYSKKHIEPFRRSSQEQIPLRFSELDVYTAKDQSKIMVSKEPIASYSSFTVLKPTDINFSLIVYKHDDLEKTLNLFFQKTFNKEARIDQYSAAKASKMISASIIKLR